MYRDRVEAGKTLSRALRHMALDKNTLVLAIPRGGVVVGWQIAQDLGLGIDIVMAKKIGAPSNPEYAIAAVDPDGEVVWPWRRDSDTAPSYIRKQAEALKEELLRKMNELRLQRPYPDLRTRDVILVDDGLATGLTALSAVRFLRRRGVKRLILAVPVASQEAIEALEPWCDSVVVPLVPEYFYAVGQWYQHFDQVPDGKVMAHLADFPHQ